MKNVNLNVDVGESSGDEKPEYAMPCPSIANNRVLRLRNTNHGSEKMAGQVRTVHTPRLSNVPKLDHYRVLLVCGIGFPLASAFVWFVLFYLPGVWFHSKGAVGGAGPTCDVSVFVASHGCRAAREGLVQMGLVGGVSGDLISLVTGATKNGFVVNATHVIDVVSDIPTGMNIVDFCSNYSAKIHKYQHTIHEWGSALDPFAAGLVCDVNYTDTERTRALTSVTKSTTRHAFVYSSVRAIRHLEFIVSIDLHPSGAALSWLLSTNASKLVIFTAGSSSEMGHVVSTACDRGWAPSGLTDATRDLDCGDQLGTLGKRYYILALNGGLTPKYAAHACANWAST